MRKHSTHSISRVFFSLLMLMIAGVNLAMAQGLSSNDIKASWDFKNGTVAYSIVSADIPAGSTFSWKVDSKNVTDGISDSGQTITLPLTNKTRSGDVTITSADNTSQTIAFSIEPKAYGVDYDGNHFYADSYQLYPDGSEGDGSKEKPFLISNDMELARLAHEVNNGAAQQMFSQKYFKLTKDIDLSKGLWTPIGTAQGIAKASDGHFFAGKFDGDGHSVSNLHIKWSFNTAKEASWGLFARLNGKGNNENEYAAVTNLIIDNALIEKLEAHMPLNNANYTVKMGIVVHNPQLKNHRQQREFLDKDQIQNWRYSRLSEQLRESENIQHLSRHGNRYVPERCSQRGGRTSDDFMRFRCGKQTCQPNRLCRMAEKHLCARCRLEDKRQHHPMQKSQRDGVYSRRQLCKQGEGHMVLHSCQQGCRHLRLQPIRC